MDSPRDMEDWEVPVSEIRDWTYTLASTTIDLPGLGNVTAFRNRAMKIPLNERELMMLAYEGEVLMTVTERVTAWRSAITVARSHAPPVHPFDSEQRLLAILNNMPYIPPNVPDDAPTLDAHDYDRWFLLTLLGKPRYDDKKASKERNIRWHRMRQDPHHEPEDWADFIRRKRDDEAQHHRASRDEPNNVIYDHMSPVGPSGLTTTMPSQSNPPPQSHHRHQAYEATSPTLQPPTFAFAAGYSDWFVPPS
ncbi:uncharacterized protein ARMOST_17411 [Armillaria ostoyae]|uniref:Uncharacterized protein n=1 Tax=Armillaria ostoyae TaxID=47428 RepID=A0A284RYX1_ARMOS|nr:uncharacterized protein ARMOST_17411 [Armillaria ostoyae]